MQTEILTCTLPGLPPVSVRVRPTAINILVGDEQPSYSFDRAGRLIGAFVSGVNYRRGFDGRVLRKWSGPAGRERRWLAAEEAGAFLDAAYELAGCVATSTGDPRVAVLQGWDRQKRAADAAAFSRIYRPVSILPPDQYLALVLQATEGCSYNRCTFCDFYRDRAFRVKGPEEFRQHVVQVQEFFGAGLALRRSLFLADANALVAPMPRVRAWLDVIAGTPGLPGAGIYSFIDAFDVHRKTVADWTELAGRGIRRVYIGMESGDDALLRFLRKPGAAADVVEAVSTLKAAGMAVSVIVMAGIGGHAFAGGHVTNTVQALNAMPLGGGDIIYVSPFVDHSGSEYGRIAAGAGVRPLSDIEIAAQETSLRTGLKNGDRGQRPQVSRYDIREFIY